MKKAIKDLKPGERAFLERGIFARRTKAGIMYGISFKHEGRRYTEIAGPRLTDARRGLAIRKAAIAQHRFGFKSKKKAPRVEQFGERYLEYAEEHKRSWRDDKRHIRKFTEMCGRKRIDEICPLDIERFKAGYGDKITKATVNRALATVKKMFSLAVAWGELRESPAKSVQLFREPEPPIKALNAKQQVALIEACDRELRPLVVTALGTGLRRSELFNLRWDNIRDGSILVTRTKSNKNRTVPINQSVQAALDSLPGPREGHVFKMGDGTPWKSCRTQWLRACKKAGVYSVVTDPETKRQRHWPRFHDIRHSFGSDCGNAGVDGFTLRELMGHASIRTTQRYVHPADESKRRAVELIDSRNESAPKVRQEVIAVDFKKP